MCSPAGIRGIFYSLIPADGIYKVQLLETVTNAEHQVIAV
jgi:hypothetical protein